MSHDDDDSPKKNTEDIDIAVSDELGTIKIIRIPENKAWQKAKIIKKWGNESRENGIIHFSYHKNNSLEDMGHYCISKKNGLNEIRDNSFNMVKEFRTEARTKTVFMSNYWKNEIESKIISITENGFIKLNNLKTKKGDQVQNKVNEIYNIQVVKSNITSAAVDINFEKVAYGGDRTPLTIFDIEEQKNIFETFPPQNPYQLERREWITCCTFLEKEKDLNSNLIFCGTADNQIYLYDIRIKKYPILIREWRESRIVALKAETEKKCWMSNAQGNIACFDLRRKNVINNLKGCISGSIRGLDIYEKNCPKFIASVGLDRFLRIHDINDKTMYMKLYCKYQLTNVIFLPNLNKELSYKDENKRKFEEIET